jgi:uncharacterized protein DUF2071
MIAGTVECTIQRRLLVNYRIEPEFVAPLLPPPFRPQLVSGLAVGGVCFIRLGRFRLGHLPPVPGLTTENAAHRFAVEWGDPRQPAVGVYVPRRDTSSRFTSIAGGKIFPGSYQLARFEVDEPGGEVHIDAAATDGGTRLSVAAAPADDLVSELFGTLQDAVDFFRRGALGFSPAAGTGCLDGVRLHSASWAAQPMSVRHFRSSLFDDQAIFPPGTCLLDSALVMRNLAARWIADQPSILPPAECQILA